MLLLVVLLVAVAYGDRAFQFNDYPLPPQRTNYICKAFPMDTSHSAQAFRFVPWVNNTKVVHHMILYQSSLAIEDYGHDYFPCEGMPKESSPLWVWAVGGGPFTLPDNVKITLGKGGIKLVLLQIHYDMSWSTDPSKETEKDSSGFLVQFDEEERELEAGMLMVGVPYENILIPASTSSFRMDNECPSSMTHEFPHDLVMFSVLPHMHTYGNSVESEVYRNGQSLGYLYKIHPWSFHHQHFYTSSITLKPGDSIMTRCTWNTSASSVSIEGGENSSDEMCYSFILYHPKIERNDCFGTSVKFVSPGETP